MEWWLILVVMLGGVVLLMFAGMPVAFAFLIVDIAGALLWWGGSSGLNQLITNVFRSVGSFTLLPVPLFILMGEVLFESGMGPKLIDALDKWLGRLPGRLSLEAVAGGTLLASLCGDTMSSVAVLSSTLLPEMQKRGYQNSMSCGPILGAGPLAVMIPPTAMGVFLAWVFKVSIGRFLIAIIIPGLLIAVFCVAYILIRCKLQPHLAPPYTVPPVSLGRKLAATVRYILPTGLIIFLVTGVIFLGVATASEAAATGALGTFLLAAAYGKLNWNTVKKSVNGTLRISAMLFMIIVGAFIFGQLITFSGAAEGLAELIVRLPVPPIAVIIAMLAIGALLGMFMSQYPIILITAPIFIPVVQALGFNPLWFAVIFLINMEMANLTPPFGYALFTMQTIVGRDIPIEELWKAGGPFLACHGVAMALIVAFPALALWLPGMMR
ncbi:MAG: TRAP transporter large permease subunit [Chloroflexi bacterium]|nr:TRAP transporter large permease subunit [Chloroflexota bacterium]